MKELFTKNGARCSICNAFQGGTSLTALWSAIMRYQRVTPLDLQTYLVCPRWSPLTCAVGEVAFRVVHIQTPQVIRCKSNSIDPLVFRHAVVLFPPGLWTSPPWTHISTFCLCSGRSASYSIGEWTPLIPQLRWVHANAHTSFLIGCHKFHTPTNLSGLPNR